MNRSWRYAATGLGVILGVTVFHAHGGSQETVKAALAALSFFASGIYVAFDSRLKNQQGWGIVGGFVMGAGIGMGISTLNSIKLL